MENPFYIDPVEEFERMARSTSSQQKRTVQAKKLFLEQYRITHGNVKRACELSGVSRKTVYLWKEKDPYFRKVLPFIGFDYVKDDIESSLMARIRRGDGNLAFKYLKKFHPNYKKPIKKWSNNSVDGYRRGKDGRFRRYHPKFDKE